MKRKKNAGHRAPLIDRLESRSYLSAVSFSGPTFVAGVDNITGIAAGDLTGAGHADLVVAGQSTGTTNSVVGIYLGKSGVFMTPTLIPIAGGTGGVAVGDFLDNGRRDIAAVDSTGNTLDVLLNDGAGNFSQGVGAGLGGSGGDTSIAVGDFNHDGNQDVAVADPTGNQVVTELSLGDSLGRFVGGASISVPSPQKVVIGDFNNDGFSDLAVLSGTTIYVALNDTHGGFATPVQYPLGASITSVSDLAVGNFNGDSLPDLVALGIASGTNAGVASVLLNQGSGTFGAAVPVTVAPGASLLGIGTFSGSGNQDIASMSTTGALDVVPGTGTGQFGQDQQVFTTQLDTPGTQAVFADFNGDGTPDIAFSSTSQGGFGVLLNTSGGGTTSPPLTTGTPSPLTPSLVTPVPTAPVISGVKLKPIPEKVLLTNNGTSTIKGPVTVGLLLSPNTGGSSTDPVLASVSIPHFNLKSHKTRTVALKIKSLPASSAGFYYLIGLVTDPAKLQSAVASSKTFTATPATVDLSGTYTLVPQSAHLKKHTKIGVNLTDAGNVIASGRLETKVYLSKTGVIDANSVLIADVTRRIALKPGKALPIHLTGTIPAATPVGGYSVIVDLDPSNAFHDTNPANNVVVSPAPMLTVS